MSYYVGLTGKTGNEHGRQFDKLADTENIMPKPYQLKTAESAKTLNLFPFPVMDIPDGWEETNTFFVDSSGFGSDCEPALTIDQFRNALFDHDAGNPDDGYIITGEGQFQVYVTAVRRIVN